MSLTFAIPFYSDPAYLEAAVESVFAQTRQDWRLVVVDDHSPHDVTERLRRFTADPRVRYVRNAQNLGMAGNWNRCLELADSRYVTILHSDDVLEPNYMDTMRALLQPGVSAAFCGARIIDGTGALRFSVADQYKRLILPKGEPMELLGEAGLSALLRGNFIMCPTLCYDKHALASMRFDALYRFVLDLDLVTRLLLEGHTIRGTRQKAFRYRRHGDNTTVHLSKNLVAFKEERSLWQQLSERAAHRGWRHAAKLGKQAHILKRRVAFEMMRDLAQGELSSSAKKAAFLAGFGR